MSCAKGVVLSSVCFLVTIMIKKWLRTASRNSSTYESEWVRMRNVHIWWVWCVLFIQRWSPSFNFNLRFSMLVVVNGTISLTYSYSHLYCWVLVIIVGYSTWFTHVLAFSCWWALCCNFQIHPFLNNLDRCFSYQLDRVRLEWWNRYSPILPFIFLFLFSSLLLGTSS